MERGGASRQSWALRYANNDKLNCLRLRGLTATAAAATAAATTAAAVAAAISVTTN